MPSWLDLDWGRMFVPSQPVLETVIRGSFTYLSLFFLLRVFRRQIGSIGPADLLVLLLIADASQNAMAGEYRAITDGLILVATIVGWEYLLDAASYYFPRLGNWLGHPALPIIEDGKVNRDHLRRELISEDELLGHLRQKGALSPADVRLGMLEGDGHFSVLMKEPSGAQDEEQTPGVNS